MANPIPVLEEALTFRDRFVPENVIANPFLKWAGGKRALVPQIVEAVPKDFEDYHEPFLGGGAVFFALAQRTSRAHLSDSNLELMLTYKALQIDVDSVIEELKRHQTKHCKDYYYRIRKQHEQKELHNLAARFIYLNKTCYNGLYRVNRDGKFNAPVGSYKNPTICDEKNLRLVSTVLSKAIIRCMSFEQTVVKRGDLVYCDPPYDNTFSGYTDIGFDAESHRDLRNKCIEWIQEGAYVIVSNSSTPLVRDLYSKFRIVEVVAPRNINCKGSERGKETELLIFGYQ